MRTRMRMRNVTGRLIATLALLATTSAVAEEHPSPSPEAQALIKELNTKDPYSRQAAFLRLEALREPATSQAIRSYLTSKDADTRAYSARALAAIDGATAIPLLLDRVQHDRSPQVRAAALLALEPIQDATAIPVLIAALRDRDPDVRMAAVDIVSRIPIPQAREAILAMRRREHNRDVHRVLDDAVKRITPSS